MEKKLEGFELGADDYVLKPYNHQELVARVQAVMRRIKKNSKSGHSDIRCGQIELRPADLQVIVPGHPPILLTPTETHVLRVLMGSQGQVVNRERLLSEVWNDSESNSNIVDVYIRRLRAKMEEDAEKPRHIVSIRGLGYKFVGK
jgi:DNA-binding response OmpR family regulator